MMTRPWAEEIHMDLDEEEMSVVKRLEMCRIETGSGEYRLEVENIDWRIEIEGI